MAHGWREEVNGCNSMTHQYLDLTDLVTAANGCECLVHLHTDDKGNNVFSIGNTGMGTTEFTSYTEALEATRDEGMNEEDCAERAGAALVEIYERTSSNPGRYQLTDRIRDTLADLGFGV